MPKRSARTRTTDGRIRAARPLGATYRSNRGNALNILHLSAVPYGEGGNGCLRLSNDFANVS
jgi:hypothetical protein